MTGGAQENVKYIKTYKMKEPVRIGAEVIEEIKFIDPQAKHLKGLSEHSGMEKTLVIAGKITNHPTVVFEEMKWKDWFAIDNIIDDFLVDGGIGGKKT